MDRLLTWLLVTAAVCFVLGGVALGFAWRLAPGFFAASIAAAGVIAFLIGFGEDEVSDEG